MKTLSNIQRIMTVTKELKSLHVVCLFCVCVSNVFAVAPTIPFTTQILAGNTFYNIRHDQILTGNTTETCIVEIEFTSTTVTQTVWRYQGFGNWTNDCVSESFAFTDVPYTIVNGVWNLIHPTEGTIAFELNANLVNGLVVVDPDETSVLYKTRQIVEDYLQNDLTTILEGKAFEKLNEAGTGFDDLTFNNGVMTIVESGVQVGAFNYQLVGEVLWFYDNPNDFHPLVDLDSTDPTFVDYFEDSSYEGTSELFFTGTASVAVPIPPIAWIIGSGLLGLLGLIGVARRKA